MKPSDESDWIHETWEQVRSTHRIVRGSSIEGQRVTKPNENQKPIAHTVVLLALGTLAHSLPPMYKSSFQWLVSFTSLYSNYCFSLKNNLSFFNVTRSLESYVSTLRDWIWIFEHLVVICWHILKWAKHIFRRRNPFYLVNYS